MNPPEEPVRPTPILYPDPPSLRRIRFLSTLLDQSIPLPFGFRIGLDPIIGLIPGVGDAVGTSLSVYLIYEAARLGIPKQVLGRMVLNVAVESLVGAIPLLGDIFDAVWKANVRNLRLLEANYRPHLPPRSASQVGGFIVLLLGILLVGVIALGVALFKLLASLLPSQT